MTSAKPNARYGIGLVSRMSGVPVETIRIWERRYSLITPERTSGGHRKYTDDHVAVLKAAAALVASGQRISAVAAMSKHALFAAAAPIAVDTGPVAPDTPFAAAIESVVRAGRLLDTAEVARLLDQPLMLYPADTLLLEFYLPLMRYVGDLWHAGSLPVRVEHFIEKLVSGRVHSLLNMAPRGGTGVHAVLACPPGELHEVGLLAAATMLRTAGIRTTYLGANLPIEELAIVLERPGVQVAVLAITSSLTAEVQTKLATACRAFRARGGLVFMGGPGAKAVVDEAQATYVSQLADLPDMVTTRSSDHV